MAGVRESTGRAARRQRRLRPSDEDRVRARNDRVPSAICRAFIFERRTHDRVSDIAGIARPCCDRDHGDFVMSADIIRFIARPADDRKPTDFPTIAFRSVLQSEQSASDAADTAPCEYAPPIYGES
jgi:hypothetical protein